MLAERVAAHDHQMVDRDRAMTVDPFAPCCLSVPDNRDKIRSWRTRRGRGEDGGGHLPVAQQIVDRAVDTLDVAGLAVLLDVAGLCRDPGHVGRLDTELLAEDPPHPHPGGLAVGPATDAPASEFPGGPPGGGRPAGGGGGGEAAAL